MKYVSLPEFEIVTSALNFETTDLYVAGGCDLYTTKAAGSDKKIFRKVDSNFSFKQAEHERLRLSLSPPNSSNTHKPVNYLGTSPFGPLNQTSTRRTFAYLVATLNASHPDYDFSQVLRPADFTRSKRLRDVIHKIDSTLQNLRPRASPGYVSPRSLTRSSDYNIWASLHWKLIDQEMKLRQCEIYAYDPQENPFDMDDPAIWSYNYFFFNKELKRVCYLYVRGQSILSHGLSPVLEPTTPYHTPRFKRSSDAAEDEGASKRARYWLGDRAVDAQAIDEGDEEEDEEVRGWMKGRGKRKFEFYSSEADKRALEENGFTSPEAEDEDGPDRYCLSRESSSVRAMSEHAVESMEV